MAAILQIYVRDQTQFWQLWIIIFLIKILMRPKIKGQSIGAKSLDIL